MLVSYHFSSYCSTILQYPAVLYCKLFLRCVPSLGGKPGFSVRWLHCYIYSHSVSMLHSHMLYRVTAYAASRAVLCRVLQAGAMWPSGLQISADIQGRGKGWVEVKHIGEEVTKEKDWDWDWENWRKGQMQCKGGEKGEKGKKSNVGESKAWGQSMGYVWGGRGEDEVIVKEKLEIKEQGMLCKRRKERRKWEKMGTLRKGRKWNGIRGDQSHKAPRITSSSAFPPLHSSGWEFAGWIWMWVELTFVKQLAAGTFSLFSLPLSLCHPFTWVPMWQSKVWLCLWKSVWGEILRKSKFASVCIVGRLRTPWPTSVVLFCSVFFATSAAEIEAIHRFVWERR